MPFFLHACPDDANRSQNRRPAAARTPGLVGIILLGISSMLNAVNIIATVVQLRTGGLAFMRLPFFVWSQLVAALLLLLAFPSLQVAAIFQLMDRLVGTSFFLPSGLVVNGAAPDAIVLVTAALPAWLTRASATAIFDPRNPRDRRAVRVEHSLPRS